MQKSQLARGELRQLRFKCSDASRLRDAEFQFRPADEEAILTIPAKRPIKPIYIRKLLAMIERRGDGQADWIRDSGGTAGRR